MTDILKPLRAAGCESTGKALNFYRRQSNLSQQEMAGLLSVPCQTYQKYEEGTDPIPGSRLSAFLEHLKIPPAEFKARLAGRTPVQQDDALSAVAQEMHPLDAYEEIHGLVDRFATLGQDERRSMLEMVKTMLEKEMGINDGRGEK